MKMILKHEEINNVKKILIAIGIVLIIAVIGSSAYAMQSVEQVAQSENFKAYTFEDRDYRCYVATARTVHSNSSTSISCMQKSNVK